ncbi:MAG TPA: pyridoxamine 5'-phosphate oxidase family protein [Chryseolinea sp.]|nr:pyridoxamine 5'-phosphate oxidase family protein [Chryseolinea sp.]
MATYPPTDKTTITRLAKRGSYDKEMIHSILDEAFVCTIAFVQNNEPVQIPTGFCRVGDKLYVHGSVGSSYLRSLAENNLPVCISVTLVDGLVLARSAFHHSMNYRSVVLFSKAERVTDAQETYQALEVFTNKVQPGRWNDIRQPNSGEWKATLILSFTIEEVSAKVRTGGPKDDEEDYALDIWAGVVPLKLERKDPIPDELLKPGIALPNYL